MCWPRTSASSSRSHCARRCADCLEVKRLADDRDAVTWVGLEYRFMPTVQALLAELATGVCGTTRMVAVREHRFPFLDKVDNWNRFSAKTGGTLVEKCCHFFDLMHQIAGARPVLVMASGAQDVNHLDEVYGGDAADMIDNAFVIVEFANGVRGMLDLSMFAEGGRFEQELTVTGDRGQDRGHGPRRRRSGSGAVSNRVSREIPAPTDAAVAYEGFHRGSSFLSHLRFHRLRTRRADPPRSPLTTACGRWRWALPRTARSTNGAPSCSENSDSGTEATTEPLERGHGRQLSDDDPDSAQLPETSCASTAVELCHRLSRPYRARRSDRRRGQLPLRGLQRPVGPRGRRPRRPRRLRADDADGAHRVPDLDSGRRRRGRPERRSMNAADLRRPQVADVVAGEPTHCRFDPSAPTARRAWAGIAMRSPRPAKMNRRSCGPSIPAPAATPPCAPARRCHSRIPCCDRPLSDVRRRLVGEQGREIAHGNAGDHGVEIRLEAGRERGEIAAERHAMAPRPGTDLASGPS